MNKTDQLIIKCAMYKLASMTKKADVLMGRGIPKSDLLKLSPRQLSEIAYSVPKYDVIPVLDDLGNMLSFGAGAQGEAFPVFASPEAGFSAKFIDNANPDLKQIANAALKKLHPGAEARFPGQLELQKHFMSGNSPYINRIFARGDFGGIGGKDAIVTQMLLKPEAFGISRESQQYKRIIKLWNRLLASETAKNTGGRIVPSDLYMDVIEKFLGNSKIDAGKLKDPVTGKLFTLGDVADGNNFGWENHNFLMHPEFGMGLSHDPLFMEDGFVPKTVEEVNRLRRKGFEGIAEDAKSFGQNIVNKGKQVANEVANGGVGKAINNVMDQGRNAVNNGVAKVRNVANNAPEIAGNFGAQVAKNMNRAMNVVDAGIAKVPGAKKIISGVGNFFRRM